MGQVTIYIEDELEARMAADARARNLSRSRWIADVIREKLDNEWPAAVREMAGSWEDFPTLEDIRDTGSGDAERESL